MKMLPKITLSGFPSFILHNNEDLNDSSQDENMKEGKKKKRQLLMRF